MDLDISLYDRCARESNEKERLKESHRTASKTKWQAIIKSAAAKGVTIDA
jgi:hypothetical protein